MDGNYRGDKKVVAPGDYRRERSKHIIKAIRKSRVCHETINFHFKN